MEVRTVKYVRRYTVMDTTTGAHTVVTYDELTTDLGRYDITDRELKRIIEDHEAGRDVHYREKLVY